MYESLNPYSYGIRIEQYFCFMEKNVSVLILILMEYG